MQNTGKIYSSIVIGPFMLELDFQSLYKYAYKASVVISY